MRRFHSYGPVNRNYHFCVERKALIERCTEQLSGMPEEGGHYFTIWAPRQTGKTWLMQEVKKEIAQKYSEQFIIGTMSMQGVVMKDDEPEELFFKKINLLFWETFQIELETQPETWEDFKRLFSQKSNLFKLPVILFIDEFDSLPPKVIDRLVTLFRDMYLKREIYRLHGIALIGVRAVLGIDSRRGSPFNIQRSLHVPNFTREEVFDLYQQYQTESEQQIDIEVVNRLYEVTRGQPGLVCWFGELLTETYNPDKNKVIDIPLWNYVYGRACRTEWNNTLLNLIAKVRDTYTTQVLELFSRSDIVFNLRTDWCNYLYLHGIIDAEETVDKNGQINQYCRFASPFIQQTIYDALTYDIIGDRLPILTLDPLDRLSDVFDGDILNIPALLERYKLYLKRLKAKGLNPWKDQPRRTDLHITEAAGHFHLYAWLQEAIEDHCVISPEFPTGNGRVDLHLKCGQRYGIIEVKSFISLTKTESARYQAAHYALKLGLSSVTLALFTPVEQEDVLNQLSSSEEISGIQVVTVAIGWG